MDYEKPKSEKKTGNQAAAIALGVTGLLTLTIQFLMAPTHTIGGVNYADAWHTTLTLLGVGLILFGFATAIATEFTIAQRNVLAQFWPFGKN